MLLITSKKRQLFTATLTTPVKAGKFNFVCFILFPFLFHDLLWLLLSDPIRGMGAWRKTMEPQKPGNSPRPGPEVVGRQRVAKERATQRVRSWTVQNESTEKKEASHLLGLRGRHQYSDHRSNQNRAPCVASTAVGTEGEEDQMARLSA